MKSINRKGAQALRNSPVGYFSAVARLQGWLLYKDNKVQVAIGMKFRIFTL
jgi:hypothetical protein